MQLLLAQPPVINSFIPATGQVGNLVTIRGSKLNSPTAVTVGSINAIIISFADTEVVAMVMPGASAGPVSVITAAGTATGSNNFIVTASKPPDKQSGSKLYGANTENTVNSAEQRFSVAVSADGNTAVIGGDFDNGSVGAVWVYTRTNNIWTQQGNKLVGNGTGTGNSAQGFSIAISADGNTFIEGGIGDAGFAGAGWVFTRDQSGAWSQQGNKLVGTGVVIGNNTTPEQGYSVGISADGNTAIIGGRRDNNYIGAAWIFNRNNGTWTEQVKLVGTGYISVASHQGSPVYLGVDMGTSVCISADGNTAIIGGPRDNNDTGAIWVFKRSGNTWSQQGNKLVGAGGTRSFNGGIQQGTSVAVSADGNTAIEGGPFDTDGVIDNNNNNNYGGAVWIFTRSNNQWSQQGNKIYATDATLGAEQGWSVSISADGNTAMVGGPTDSSFTGASWIYTRVNNAWTQRGKKLVGTGAVGTAKQGWSTSISADGNTAIAGGPEDYYQAQGAFWVFADSNTILPVTLTNFTAYLLGKAIQTTWTGYSEITLSSYDVERGDNGYSFARVANINAATNGAVKNIYSWLDASPFAGDNFYRVKAISKDGGLQYSPVIKVNTGYGLSSIKVYPNPVYGKIIHLKLNNILQGNYQLTVYSLDGKTLYRKEFTHAGGTAWVTIHLNNAAAGNYQLEMKNNVNSYHATVMTQ